MRWLRRLLSALRPPSRHWAYDWDGTHATCYCGYHDVNDWDLRKHLEES